MAFPVKPIIVGRSQRWDRHAIDRYLDSLSGLKNDYRGDSESEVIDEIERHFR